MDSQSGKSENKSGNAEEEEVVRGREEQSTGSGDKESARELEHELSVMETELDAMQQELVQVQKERELLESQRRVLKSVAPPGRVDPPCVPVRGPLAQRETWRNDQLIRLQDELEAKVLENCELRTQVERLKEAMESTQIGLENWETRAMELEQKLRSLENHKNKMVMTKEAALEQQQILAAAQQKYRATQDEMEELRSLIEDQAGHLEGYRNKYLLAQQQVEEQRRQLDQVEAEQEKLADQVQNEIHRVKAEFEDKLQDLIHLPDILKNTQSKLQETLQLRAIAEHNCQELSREFGKMADKNADYEKEINMLRAKQQTWNDERQTLLSHIETYERKCNKLREDNKRLKEGILQMEEVGSHNEKLYEDAVLELGRVKAELEAVKDDSVRTSHRLRERAETMRVSFHSQIAELETELAQSRANAAAALRDKEELQQKLQTQVSNITQSFGQAQDRIIKLQSVVNLLKSNVLNIDPSVVETSTNV